MLKNLTSLFLSFLLTSIIYGQTIINTTHPNNNGNGSVTFNVQNTNAFDIIITGVQCHLGSTTTNNIELLYNTSPYVDFSPPWDFGTVGAGQNGWISAGTGVVSNSNTADGIVPVLTSISLTIPAGATYQLGLLATTMQYSTLASGAGTNTFSSGGVNLLTGDGISWGGTVYPTTPVNYPRGLIGGITFIPAVPCTSPPTAGAVAAANNPICPSTNNTLSLVGGTAGTGQTYQWQSSATGAIGSYTNIFGATNSTYISNQTSNTYYRCYMTCGGLTDTTVGLLVNTENFLNCYCTSNATSTGDDEILGVSIGTLNNVSNCSSTGGSGSIQNQYSNYTNLPAPNLKRSVSYPFNVNIGTCGGNYNNMMKIFIDYNQNGSFADLGEEVYASSNAVVGPHIESGSITIPLTAALGTTRMRVIIVETTAIGDITSCGTYSYGETEDYFVNITPAPTCPLPTALFNLGATDTEIELSWTAGGAETSWQLQYGPAGFTLGTGDSIVVNTNPYTLNGLTPNSFYQVYVMAICSSSDSSFYSGPISFNTYNQGLYMDWTSECPSGGFIDIASTGTDLNLFDDTESQVTLPFNFLYQGILINECTVSNNGRIVLGQYNFTNILSPWADDLDDETGNVYHQTIGVSPNRTFIVQWDNSCNFSGYIGAPTVTFQVQIEEATGKIWFVYDDVVFGPPNAIDDYAANAEISLNGPNQNFSISSYSPAYLQNNSCVEFYYTDCPMPQNFVSTFLSGSEIQFSWTPGISSETNWIIEYGPEGFSPGTGTFINETNPNSQITSLTQLTDYTIYIYANCANGDTSRALIHHFTTLPFCSNPSGFSGLSIPDSIDLSWSWIASNPNYQIQSFNIQYGISGFSVGSGTIIGANGINPADTIADPSLIASGVYQVYIQAVCSTGDTSAYVGPITLVMPITNDDVCGVEPIQLGQTYTFNNNGATVESGESVIAPTANGAQTTTGWDNSVLDGTLWYSFIAPSADAVRINSTAIDYNGQVAVYTANDCSDFTTFNLIAANDNEIGGTSQAPNFTICDLIPGNTYYIMYDRYDWISGNFSLNVSAINLNAGSAMGLTQICYGTSLDLNSTLTGSNSGGVWSSNIPAANASISGSNLSTVGLGYSIFNFQYTQVDGCASETVLSQVQIMGPSNVGQDGSITACRNQPLDLLSGLNGTVDLNGSWYDPSNILLPSSQITTANSPGQYYFDYIVGNGVCPEDTAEITVIVQDCDWLSIEENELEQISVYPNPSNGMVFIESGSDENYVLNITDINGRAIHIANNIYNGKNSIDLTDASKGIYIFKLSTEKTQRVFRVVIQ